MVRMEGTPRSHARGSSTDSDDISYLAARIATRHQAAMSASAGVTQQPSS
jgi:hypothetical protein